MKLFNTKKSAPKNAPPKQNERKYLFLQAGSFRGFKRYALSSHLKTSSSKSSFHRKYAIFPCLCGLCVLKICSKHKDFNAKYRYFCLPVHTKMHTKNGRPAGRPTQERSKMMKKKQVTLYISSKASDQSSNSR